MEHFGREQGDAAVMLLGVVPGKESLAEGACVLDRIEEVRKFELKRGRAAVARGGAVTACPASESGECKCTLRVFAATASQKRSSGRIVGYPEVGATAWIRLLSISRLASTKTRSS